MRSAAARVVLVVGASSGIGLATAQAFAARGDRLVLASRSADALQETARRCTTDGAASALVVPADVCDEVAVDALVDAALEAHGRIDVVVHSAMVMAYGDAEVLPAKVFEQVVDTAVHGTANVARAVLPVMRRQHRGVLILVNSIVGQIAAPHMGAYAAAKWGQLGLARTLQLETRDAAGVHVSVVVPGGVDTPIYYQAANYAGRVGRPPPPVDPPAKVARTILRCADRPRRQVSVGALNHLMVFGFRVLPWAYDLMVTPLMSRIALSRQETAPTDGNVFAPIPARERERGRPTSGGQ